MLSIAELERTKTTHGKDQKWTRREGRWVGTNRLEISNVQRKAREMGPQCVNAHHKSRD